MNVDAFALLALGASGLAAALYVLAWWRAPREEAALLQHAPTKLCDTVVVVIPARNEENDLPATLDALLATPDEPLEVYVFDDDSDDNTADIVRQRVFADPRLHLLQPADVPADLTAPDGVFGKPWAQHRAVHAVWLTQPGRIGNHVVVAVDVDVEVDAFDELHRRGLVFVEEQPGHAVDQRIARRCPALDAQKDGH